MSWCLEEGRGGIYIYTQAHIDSGYPGLSLMTAKNVHSRGWRKLAQELSRNTVPHAWHMRVLSTQVVRASCLPGFPEKDQGARREEWLGGKGGDLPASTTLSSSLKFLESASIGVSRKREVLSWYGTPK